MDASARRYATEQVGPIVGAGTTTVATYKLRQVRGAILLVASSSSSQYAATSTTSVWNLRAGRSYAVAEYCSELGIGLCGPNEDATASAAFINSRGQAAAAISPNASNTTTIVGFSS